MNVLQKILIVVGIAIMITLTYYNVICKPFPFYLKSIGITFAIICAIINIKEW